MWPLACRISPARILYFLLHPHSRSLVFTHEWFACSLCDPVMNIVAACYFGNRASSSRLYVRTGLCLFSSEEKKEKPPTGLCKRSWSAFFFPITNNLLTEPFLSSSLTPPPPFLPAFSLFHSLSSFLSTQAHRQSSLWSRKLVPMKPFLFGRDWVQPSGPGCHTAPLALHHGRRRLLVSPPNCGQQLKSRGSVQGTGHASSDSSFLHLVTVLSRLCSCRGTGGPWLCSPMLSGSRVTLPACHTSAWTIWISHCCSLLPWHAANSPGHRKK